MVLLSSACEAGGIVEERLTPKGLRSKGRAQYQEGQSQAERNNFVAAGAVSRTAIGQSDQAILSATIVHGGLDPGEGQKLTVVTEV